MKAVAVLFGALLLSEFVSSQSPLENLPTPTPDEIDCITELATNRAQDISQRCSGVDLASLDNDLSPLCRAPLCVDVLNDLYRDCGRADVAEVIDSVCGRTSPGDTSGTSLGTSIGITVGVLGILVAILVTVVVMAYLVKKKPSSTSPSVVTRTQPQAFANGSQYPNTPTYYGNPQPPSSQPYGNPRPPAYYSNPQPPANQPYNNSQPPVNQLYQKSTNASPSAPPLYEEEPGRTLVSSEPPPYAEVVQSSNYNVAAPI